MTLALLERRRGETRGVGRKRAHKWLNRADDHSCTVQKAVCGEKNSRRKLQTHHPARTSGVMAHCGSPTSTLPAIERHRD